MRAVIRKGYKLLKFDLRLIIVISSLLLLVIGVVATLCGVLGALTVNTPPFDENTYVDHGRSPFQIQTLIHLNPLTLLLYNGIAVTSGSIFGVVQYSCPSVISQIIHITLMFAALGFDWSLGYSIYWDNEAMSKLLNSMRNSMKHYNEKRKEGSFLFFNSTSYWDLMQNSRDCCGFTEFHDWIQTPYHHHKSNQSFPDSCCFNPKPKCGAASFGISPHDVTYAPMRNRGCLSTFPESLTTEFHRYAIIGQAVGTLLVISAFISLFLVILTTCDCWIHSIIKKKLAKVSVPVELKRASAKHQSRKTGTGQRSPNMAKAEVEIEVLHTVMDTEPRDLEPEPETKSKRFQKSLVSFRRSSAAVMRSVSTQFRSKKNLVRETVSNFLFPTTSSTRSYVQDIFRRMTKDQGTNPSNTALFTTQGHQRSPKQKVSSYSLTEDKTEPRQNVFVRLDSRENLGQGESAIIPSLLAIPKPKSPTLILQNELPGPKKSWMSTVQFNFMSKIGFGDRKSEGSESIGKTETLLKVGSPCRVGPMSPTTSVRTTDDSIATLYRYHEQIVPFEQLNYAGSGIQRLNSLEGLRISPSEESVRVILNPMFGYISSDSPDELMIHNR